MPHVFSAVQLGKLSKLWAEPLTQDMAHKRLRTLEEELSEAKAAAQAAAEAAAVAAVVSPRQEDGDGSRASAAAVSALEAENAALKKRIAELLEEIERLSESVRSLEGRLSDAASQPGDAGGLDNDDALRAMRANLAELMAALAEAQAEAARLARLNAELEAALAARAGGDEAEDERLRAELTKLQTQFRESPYNTGRHIATPATPAAPTAAGEPANTSVGGPADAGDATAEGAAVETAGAVTQTEAEPEVNVSIVETPKVHEAHEPQQPTPEPEPEPETQLQPATPHTVDPGQSSMRPLTGVSMVSSDSRPVTAVANEVAELREAIAREAAMAEELLSVKSELQRLRDDSDFERVEWEREKRGELLDAKGETRERGCQTDTEEEAALQEKKELSEREVSRVTHNERVRHKPRFIVPLPEEPLAQEPRDAKPLRWLLRIVRAMYDDKYLSDAVSIRPRSLASKRPLTLVLSGGQPPQPPARPAPGVHLRLDRQALRAARPRRHHTPRYCPRSPGVRRRARGAHVPGVHAGGVRHRAAVFLPLRARRHPRPGSNQRCRKGPGRRLLAR